VDYVELWLVVNCGSRFVWQENEAKKGRAVKKTEDERELTQLKAREIERYMYLALKPLKPFIYFRAVERLIF